MDIIRCLCLGSQSKSFREISKTGNELQVEEEKKRVWATILYLANTYTGAKFEKPLSIDQTYIIDASTELIFNHFGSLSFSDLKTSFEMAVSNKLESVNLETYYGKFSVKTLATVLNAYSLFRSRVIIEFNRLQDAKKKELSQEDIFAQNEIAKEMVIKKYQAILQQYREDGTIDESKIFSHWGRILVEAGIIKFSDEEKKQIFEEAKNAVIRAAKIELSENTNPMRRKSLIKILEDVAHGNQNEDFYLKASVKYSNLIVVKSILG